MSPWMLVFNSAETCAENNLVKRTTKSRRRIDRRRRLLLVSSLVSMAMLRWPPRSVVAPASIVIGFLVTIKASRGISSLHPTTPKGDVYHEARMRSKVLILQFYRKWFRRYWFNLHKYMICLFLFYVLSTLHLLHPNGSFDILFFAYLFSNYLTHNYNWL